MPQTKRWVVYRDPKPSDALQGVLGDCWLLSALAVIAEYPDLVKQLFLDDNFNPARAYQVRYLLVVLKKGPALHRW
jgi:calpain-15